MKQLYSYISAALLLFSVVLSSCRKHSEIPEPRFVNSDLSATDIAPGLTVIETTDMTTMYLVEGDSIAMLIDTGTTCADLDKVVDSLTDKPYIVVATHGHPDHIGNVKYFSEFYMHPGDSCLDYAVLREYPGKILSMADGDVFNLGGRKLEVVHTPGHTPGSVCLVDYENGMAFTGDAFGSGQLWMQLQPQIPFATLAESCGRVIELMTERGIDKLYVGHYPYLKRPLSIDYLLDVAVAARRLDAGYTEGSTEFGTDGARLFRNGSAEIVYRPENTGKHEVKAPVVLLKLDDVHFGEDTPVPERWNYVLDIVKDKNLKANLGIIGFSLDSDREDYFQWLRDVAARGDIEFWNHGYRNRMGMDEDGEFEQDYETQYRALHLTDSLATAKVGLELRGWGPHWTDCNEYTDSALATVENIELAFGYPENHEKFGGVFVPFNLEMEYPFHNPVYSQFLANYLGKYRYLDSFYLQGHPNSWDEGRRREFEQIVDQLVADGASFVTISEFIDMSQQK